MIRTRLTKAVSHGWAYVLMARAFSSDELLFLREENIFRHELKYKANFTAQKEMALGKTNDRYMLGQGLVRSAE